MKKNILLLLDHASVGGCQEVIYTWFKEFEKNNEYQLHICVLHGEGEYIEKYRTCGVLTYSLSKYKYNPFIIPKLFLLIKKINPEVIHNNLIISTCLGSLFANLLNIKHIITHVQNQKPLVDIYKFIKPIYQLACAKSTILIAVSEQTKRSLIEEFSQDEKIIQIIPNTFNPSLNQSNSSDVDRLKSKLNINKDTYIIGNAARLIYYKNQKLLIKAFAEFNKIHPNSILLLTGEGPDYDNLKKLIENLKLKDKVLLLGLLQHDIKQELNYISFLNALDCFVLSSDIEGFPLVALEAMYAKNLIISTKVAGMKDDFTDSEEIFLVDIGNQEQLLKAMNKAYQLDPLERDSFKNKAYQKVITKYSPKGIANQIFNLYTKS